MNWEGNGKKNRKKEIRPPQEVELADGSQKGVECEFHSVRSFFLPSYSRK